VHNVLMDVANVGGAPQDFEAPNKQFQAEVTEPTIPLHTSIDLLLH